MENTTLKRAEEWKDEFREYFDKTLKPKKPTVKTTVGFFILLLINKIGRLVKIKN